jgi:tetratricopeptide (TPR) repeat protein
MNQINPDAARRTMMVWALCLLLAGAGATLLRAQEEGAAAEPGTLDTIMEPTSEGNVVQASQMVFHQGMRDLGRSAKLAEKAAATAEPDKAAKLLEKSQEANQSAIRLLTEALQQNPTLIDGYVGLGLAYRRAGKFQEAMQVHAIGLGKDPESMENFRGWSESMLALDMLGDATNAYATFAEQGSPRAAVLMEEIKKWLAAKQTDPGDLDPADVQRLADWVAEHGG